MPSSPLPRVARVGLLLPLLFALAWPGLADSEADDKLRRATVVFEELLKESPPPQELLDRSACIAVIPRVIEGAFGLGGSHGKGVMSCRRPDGEWSPPAFLRSSAGSVGFQIGFESTDLVLLIVDDRSARSLMRSKFTLGADAKVAAGPADAGANATTDARLDAEIYSYANSTGFFAGAALSGAKLKIQRKEISRYYPEHPVPEDLLFGSAEVELSSAAQRFVDVLP
ncbi:MAG: lipid-binding SYLF domain-containing protein [Thermoanaerobaculia bacterium]|nr:lipid-binding SYLF domain-containing protein [Thermoanaerobaculia bacterium]